MATVIKAGNLRSDHHGVQHSVFNFTDMSDQANQYLDQVREEAARIVARAEQQAQQICGRAQQQGQEAAVQSALEMLRKQQEQKLATLLPALAEAADQIKQAKQDWLRQWEKNAVHLASAMAARIVRREAVAEPQITLQWIREALQLAAGSEEVTLHLNPADYETLGESLAHLAAEMGKLAPTDIIADPQISPASCRVETRFGSIDQQIESQLARIEEELT